MISHWICIYKKPVPPNTRAEDEKLRIVIRVKQGCCVNTFIYTFDLFLNKSFRFVYKTGPPMNYPFNSSA